MNTIEDYIIVENTIPKELCKELIDECNKKKWKKHTWNNYATGTFESEPEKELDIMPCTKEGLKSEEHRARHALGRVPVLEDGDISFFESGAIIEYVLEKYKSESETNYNYLLTIQQN